MWIFLGSAYFIFEFILKEYIVWPPQLKISGSVTAPVYTLIQITKGNMRPCPHAMWNLHVCKSYMQ